ncbi:MAG: MBOAT family protein [Clostridiales bacterium]|nr:MBOAT family protein [Clostridiales bacterium]
MSIVSIQFLVFLVAVIVMYYILPQKIQYIVLLFFSYAFYLIGGVKPVIFIIVTTVTVFYSGLWIEGVRNKTDDKVRVKKQMRRILFGVAVFNFGTLFLLKYYNYFADKTNNIFGLFEYNIDLPLINIILPMGISFYTFQAIGYCIDIYRNKIKAERNFARFALFISFFPQVIQGPISRYNDLGEQLSAFHKFNYKQFTFGLQLMLWGFFKKLVIADRLAIVVDNVFGSYTYYDGTQTFLAIICYAIQIYADFSGGIDIVRGAAQCLGFDLMENFKRPYFGTSVAEYWRRWHISLTSWMRDYVFFPIALSKFSNKIGKFSRKNLKGHIGKQIPSYLPTFVTFFLIGVWHGAGGGFIVFGFYNAILMVLGMMFKPAFEKINRFFGINTKCLSWKVWQIIRTFFIMAAGKCITRSVNVAAGIEMLKKCADLMDFNNIVYRLFSMGLNVSNCFVLILALVLFLIVSIMQENDISIREKMSQQILPFRWSVYIFMILAVIIFGMYGEGFDVSQFIYRGF